MRCCRMEVSDDVRRWADPAADTGLRERADRLQVLDGALDVASRAQAGTHITATIPLAAP
jgi:signal transduction histidine kinase